MLGIILTDFFVLHKKIVAVTTITWRPYAKAAATLLKKSLLKKNNKGFAMDTIMAGRRLQWDRTLRRTFLRQWHHHPFAFSWRYQIKQILVERDETTSEFVSTKQYDAAPTNMDSNQQWRVKKILKEGVTGLRQRWSPKEKRSPRFCTAARSRIGGPDFCYVTLTFYSRGGLLHHTSRFTVLQ